MFNLIVLSLFTIATINAEPVWETLALSDCNGGISFLPSSPMAFHLDGSQSSNMIGMLADELLERTTCSSDDGTVTQEEILERFIPSVNMMMSQLFGFEGDVNQAHNPNSQAGQRQSFYNAANPVFRTFGTNVRAAILGLVPVGTAIDLKTILTGIECDPASYKAGSPCRMKIDLMDFLGIDLGITAQKCSTKPGQAHKHYATLNCIGEMCGYLFKPCTASADCGSAGFCKDVDLDVKNMLTLLSNIGLINGETEISKFESAAADIEQCAQDATTMSLSYGWRVVNGLTKWADGYFGNGEASSAAKFGVCLPKILNIENEMIFEALGNKAQTWIQRFDGTSKSFEANSKVTACTAKGCDVDRVGDMICDAQCNNVECYHDGGDCLGPASLQAQRDGTGNGNKKFVTVSSEDISDGTYISGAYLAPYESYQVLDGACVKAYNNGNGNGKTTGNYPFYGSISTTDVDLCKSKDETACTNECTWVAIQACTADTFAENAACSGIVQKELKLRVPTNGKKTKFFISGAGGDSDTCSRHTLTNPMCGDGRCDAVYTWNCVAPFCDPNVDYSSEQSASQMRWYFNKVSEKTTCPMDCFGGANTCATEDSEVLIGVDLKNNYQFKADAYKEFVPTTKAGAVPIIQAWDGSLSAGDKSNSPERMYGRKYVTPTSDLFATGNGALAFLRHTCDGKLGFNMGNGLHLAFQIPKLPDFVQKFSSIVKDIQSCRQALNGAAELTTAEFRNKWSLWTLDPFFQRLTSPTLTSATSDPTINPWNVMNQITGLLGEGESLRMPATCTQGLWEEKGRCRLKFTGLKLLLSSTEPEDLFIEIKRCTAPNAGSLPAFGIVADGPQLKFSAPIKFCTGNTDCNTGLTCVDIAATTGMENIFQDQKLSFTPANSAYSQPSQVAFNFPLMSDPISALVFGQRNGAKNTCSEKSWYGKGTQRAIRHMIRRANNGPSDGLTDLKICLPLTDTQKLLEGVQRFIPELACGGDYSSEPCSGEKLIIRNEDSSTSIRGLEATEEEATMYKLLAQYSLRSDGKWNMAAEEGRAFLTTTVSIDEKFTASACSQTNAIRSQIIQKLKANNYNLWQDLEPRHVLIQCTGYTPPATGTATALRRLGELTDRRNLATQELQINVQVDKKKEAEAIVSAKAAIGSKSAVTSALATAGVTDSTGEPITEAAVGEPNVASSTSNSIVVENLPADLQSAMGADNPKNKGAEFPMFFIYIGVGVLIFFVGLIGLYVFIYLPYCKKQNTIGDTNNNVATSVKEEPVTVLATPVPINM